MYQWHGHNRCSVVVGTELTLPIWPQIPRYFLFRFVAIPSHFWDCCSLCVIAELDKHGKPKTGNPGGGIFLWESGYLEVFIGSPGLGSHTHTHASQLIRSQPESTWKTIEMHLPGMSFLSLVAWGWIMPDCQAAWEKLRDCYWNMQTLNFFSVVSDG